MSRRGDDGGRHISIGPARGLDIDPYERSWIITTFVLLASFVIAVAVAGFALGFQLPGSEGRVDPRTVAQSGPFANPGLREVAPGIYDVYIISQTWSFAPRSFTVPVGSKVTFYVTSVDVQHGFKLQGTSINMQIVPGHVSKLTHTFKEVGEYPYICTEYCGLGHAGMFGSVTVEPRSGGGS